jgi:hypothetical protein
MVWHRHTRQDIRSTIQLGSTITHVWALASKSSYNWHPSKKHTAPLNLCSAFLSKFTTLSKDLFHISLMVLVHCRPQINIVLEWNTSPNSHTSLKGHNSANMHRDWKIHWWRTGFSPLSMLLFQKTYTCSFLGCISPDYNSGKCNPVSTLSFSLYIRNYWRYPC